MITAGFWVLVASLWMEVSYMSGALDRISTNSMEFHVDFESFWRSAEAMLEGANIYDTGVRLVNLNPPIWTVLIFQQLRNHLSRYGPPWCPAEIYDHAVRRVLRVSVPIAKCCSHVRVGRSPWYAGPVDPVAISAKHT